MSEFIGIALALVIAILTLGVCGVWARVQDRRRK
jgi:uncharacterized membrane protein YjgN (DUF898 family)